MIFCISVLQGKPESTMYFHDENLTVLVDNLFVAGMETTTTTLRWGLLLMMQYPDIQSKTCSIMTNDQFNAIKK